jgi:hypothetical protein
MSSQPSTSVAENAEIPGGPLNDNMEANDHTSPTSLNSWNSTSRTSFTSLQSRGVLHACGEAAPHLIMADTSNAYLSVEQILNRLPWLHRWAFLAPPERHSRLAKLLSSKSFPALVAGVIMVNTFVIALTSDFNMAGAVRQSGYQVTGKHAALGHGKLAVSESAFWVGIEYFFTAFYFLELLLRIKVHGVFLLKSDDWRWILWDIVLVMLSFVDMVLYIHGYGGLFSSASLS